MEAINQFKVVILMICVFLVMQSNACESKRQNRMISNITESASK